MFNTNAQCYQNISQVLLTSVFILWPTCTRGFGIREKSDAVCRFLAYFCAVLRFSDPPLRPPLYRALYGDAMLVPIRMDTNAAAGNFLLQKRELISRGNHENHERLESIITSRYLT